MIAIRVDGNKVIATGHVMRCLTIAEELRKFDNVVFILADESPCYLLELKGFQSVCMQTDYCNPESEISILKNVIIEHNIDKMLVDSYFVTENYFSELSKHCKVIYIDDMGCGSYDVDMLINYNIFAHKFGYSMQYMYTKTKLLLGCTYTPLRNEFQNIKTSFRSVVKNVLITTGGTDSFNVAGKLLDKIIKQNLFSDIEFHVIVGSMNQNTKFLKELALVNDNIYVYQNVNNMAKHMLSCDIALTAGGSTLYELCACGVSVICFSMADNQIIAVEQFEKEELALYAGDFRNNESDCLNSLIACLFLLIDNCNIRREFYEKMILLLDGNGASRIANEVIQL